MYKENSMDSNKIKTIVNNVSKTCYADHILFKRKSKKTNETLKKNEQDKNININFNISSYSKINASNNSTISNFSNFSNLSSSSTHSFNSDILKENLDIKNLNSELEKYIRKSININNVEKYSNPNFQIKKKSTSTTNEEYVNKLVLKRKDKICNILVVLGIDPTGLETLVDETNLFLCPKVTYTYPHFTNENCLSL